MTPMRLRGRTQLSSRGAECKSAASHDVHNACFNTNLPVPFPLGTSALADSSSPPLPPSPTGNDRYMTGSNLRLFLQHCGQTSVERYRPCRRAGGGEEGREDASVC